MKIKVNPYIIVLDVPCHNLDEFIPELFAHAAVYREVDWAGQASEGVDGQHNVVGQIVINPIILQFFLRNQRERHYYVVIFEQIIVKPRPQTPKPQTQKPRNKGPWADTKIL